MNQQPAFTSTAQYLTKTRILLCCITYHLRKQVLSWKVALLLALLAVVEKLTENATTTSITIDKNIEDAPVLLVGKIAIGGTWLLGIFVVACRTLCALLLLGLLLFSIMGNDFNIFSLAGVVA